MQGKPFRGFLMGGIARELLQKCFSVRRGFIKYGGKYSAS